MDRTDFNHVWPMAFRHGERAKGDGTSNALPLCLPPLTYATHKQMNSNKHTYGHTSHLMATETLCNRNMMEQKVIPSTKKPVQRTN